MTNQGQKDTANDSQRFDEVAQKRADRTGEFSTLLQIRQLEVRDAPFRGFDSPPGRF